MLQIAPTWFGAAALQPIDDCVLAKPVEDNPLLAESLERFLLHQLHDLFYLLENMRVSLIGFCRNPIPEEHLRIILRLEDYSFNLGASHIDTPKALPGYFSCLFHDFVFINITLVYTRNLMY